MVFSVDGKEGINGSRYSIVVDDKLRTLIVDLEMSFGKVEVIHETQFQNAAIMTGMTPDTIDGLSFHIGLRTAANHELPAVIVIEKLRDQIGGSEMNTLIPNSGLFVRTEVPELGVFKEPEFAESKHEEEPAKIALNSPASDKKEATKTNQSESETSQPSSQYKTPESDTCQIASKFESFIDMSMIKITSGGYVGSFLDRHLVYSIENQNRVVNLERGGARTCQVTRRFSDFVAVRDYLLAKYPFRCVPRLPAKRVQMFSDEAFLLDRQKSLRRFLGILAHHHMYKSDPLIQAFIYNQKVNRGHADLAFLLF